MKYRSESESEMEGTRKKLYLLDHDESQIIGAKLPSNGQVLRVLFHNLRNVKLNLKSSASLVIKEVQIFWEKARIPMKRPQYCIDKLDALYQEWVALHKSCNRSTETQKNREKEFVDKLDDLFDIAPADALKTIKIEEDKLFLLSQRKKGRPGSMIGSDHILYRKEQKKAFRKEQEESRQAQCEVEAVQGKYSLCNSILKLKILIVILDI